MILAIILALMLSVNTYAAEPNTYDFTHGGNMGMPNREYVDTNFTTSVSTSNYILAEYRLGFTYVKNNASYGYYFSTGVPNSKTYVYTQNFDAENRVYLNFKSIDSDGNDIPTYVFRKQYYMVDGVVGYYQDNFHVEEGIVNNYTFLGYGATSWVNDYEGIKTGDMLVYNGHRAVQDAITNGYPNSDELIYAEGYSGEYVGITPFFGTWLDNGTKGASALNGIKFTGYENVRVQYTVKIGVPVEHSVTTDGWGFSDQILKYEWHDLGIYYCDTDELITLDQLEWSFITDDLNSDTKYYSRSYSVLNRPSNVFNNWSNYERDNKLWLLHYKNDNWLLNPMCEVNIQARYYNQHGTTILYGTYSSLNITTQNPFRPSTNKLLSVYQHVDESAGEYEYNTNNIPTPNNNSIITDETGADVGFNGYYNYGNDMNVQAVRDNLDYTITLVGEVPVMIAQMFMFLPSWVITMMAVSIGIICVIGILKALL